METRIVTTLHAAYRRLNRVFADYKTERRGPTAVVRGPMKVLCVALLMQASAHAAGSCSINACLCRSSNRRSLHTCKTPWTASASSRLSACPPTPRYA